MLLLEGVELYGLGNWVKVAEHVGKLPEDCKAHYFQVYVETDTFPVPQAQPEMEGVDIRRLIEERRKAGAERIAQARQQSAVASKPKSTGTAIGMLNMNKAAVSTQPGSKLKGQPSIGVEGTLSGGVPPLSKGGKSGGGGGDGGVENGNATAKNKKQKVTGGSKLASPAVGGVGGDATPATSSFGGGGGGAIGGVIGGAGAKAPAVAEPGGAPLMLSEAQQTGYHIKRNEFDPEYDHEAESIISELDFPEDEPEEARQAKLRLIEIYNQRLDERQRRYQFVLSRGLVNVKRQSSIDRRRSPAERELVGRMRVVARYLPQPQWEALAEGVAAEARIRARIAQLQQYRAMGMRTFEQVDRFEAQEAKKKKEVPPSVQAGKSRLQRIPVDEMAMEAELGGIGHVHAAAAVHAQHATVPDGRGADGLHAWRARRGVLLDIAALPDIEPLNSRERALCANQRYLPAQYLAIKADTVRMQSEKGAVSLQDMLKLPYKVSQVRTAELHEFFVDQGWIKAPSGAGGGGGGKRGN